MYKMDSIVPCGSSHQQGSMRIEKLAPKLSEYGIPRRIGNVIRGKTTPQL